MACGNVGDLEPLGLRAVLRGRFDAPESRKHGFRDLVADVAAHLCPDVAFAEGIEHHVTIIGFEAAQADPARLALAGGVPVQRRQGFFERRARHR